MRAPAPLVVESFGGLSPALYGTLRAAAEWRENKLAAVCRLRSNLPRMLCSSAGVGGWHDTELAG